MPTSAATPQHASARNPLWEFAVEAYDRNGVKKACLALQNRFGADVNMIMFLLWLADSDVGKDHLAQYMGAALKLSRDWQRSLVEPLRNARNNLKDYIESNPLTDEHAGALKVLRERIKACELDAERMQTLAIYNLVTDNADDSARANRATAREHALNHLNVYFSATGVTLDPLGKSHVEQILDAVFG
jgi:uncharacterized protein (TIGR02444 family)